MSKPNSTCQRPMFTPSYSLRSPYTVGSVRSANPLRSSVTFPRPVSPVVDSITTVLTTIIR